jgi:hypothetical protein
MATEMEDAGTAGSKKCPSCSTEVPVYFDNSRFIACPKCQTIFNSQAARAEKAILGKNKVKQQPISLLIQLGHYFEWKQTKYQVVGMADTKLVYRDHISPDDSGSMKYREWSLKSKDGQYLTITESIYGNYISMEVQPTHTENPEGRTTLTFFNDRVYNRVAESGHGTRICFFGEADDLYLPGDRFKYASYKDQNFLDKSKQMITYGVEWKEGHRVDTHTYYRQFPLSKFNLRKNLRKHNDFSEYDARNRAFSFIRGVVLVSFLLCVLFMIVSLISDGKTVYRVTASLPELMTDEGTLAFDEPFEIPQSNQIYTIIFGAQLISPNTEIAAAAEILNENENVISLMEGEFWRSQGVADGEAWAESNLQVSQQFSAKETGVFRPVLIADSVQTTVLHPDDYLFFEVRKGGLLTRYFFIAALVFFFLTVWVYNPTSSERLKRRYFALISKKK